MGFLSPATQVARVQCLEIFDSNRAQVTDESLATNIARVRMYAISSKR